METFGTILRTKREEKGLLLREVAAAMDMDTTLLSKIERDERRANKEHVLAFAKYYKVKEDELLIAWLSDKLVYEVGDDDLALKAIQVAEEKIKYNKKKK